MNDIFTKLSYDKLYTLDKPMDDEVHSILNGKIFGIIADEKKQLNFVDVVSREILVSSTAMVRKEDIGGIIYIETISGTRYLLRKIDDTLPSGDRLFQQLYPEMWDKLHPVSSIKLLRRDNISPEYRAYCDRKIVWEYTFEEPITEDQFRKFLTEEQKVTLKDKSDWWAEYDTVSANLKAGGRVWKHTHIVPSTH